MSAVVIGYARVSTEDQNLDLQRDALTRAGCTRVYEDRMSGAKAARPGLRLALEVARAGDQLVVWQLDRLGRSLSDNGFWSLTVYNKEHFFEPNGLNRFSLGTKSKSMKQKADGSLTLYFQNQSPGADKESNWVPTPTDEFSLYIRAYWPKDAILNGGWVPPAAIRAG